MVKTEGNFLREVAQWNLKPTGVEPFDEIHNRINKYIPRTTKPTNTPYLNRLTKTPNTKPLTRYIKI